MLCRSSVFSSSTIPKSFVNAQKSGSVGEPSCRPPFDRSFDLLALCAGFFFSDALHFGEDLVAAAA